jgi:hypothetical protein
MGVVLEEADETVYWPELLIESRTMDRPRLQDLPGEAEELVAIFAASRLTAMSGTRR